MPTHSAYNQYSIIEAFLALVCRSYSLVTFVVVSITVFGDVLSLTCWMEQHVANSTENYYIRTNLAPYILSSFPSN